MSLINHITELLPLDKVTKSIFLSAYCHIHGTWVPQDKASTSSATIARLSNVDAFRVRARIRRTPGNEVGKKADHFSRLLN